MKYFLILFVSFLTLSFAHAHEGHNKVPGAINAPHGGKIKGTTDYYIEVLASGENLSVYVFDHDMNLQSVDKLSVNAVIKFPRGGKTEKLQLKADKDKLVAQLGGIKTHRYTLELEVKGPSKTEKVTFNIEP